MANLPTDYGSITKSLNKKSKRHLQSTSSNEKGSSEGPSMEGSKPALPAEPGTLKTSLLETPGTFVLKKCSCYNKLKVTNTRKISVLFRY